MPCYSRLDGWMGQDGQFTLKRSEAWTDRPMSVSCGRCVGCTERRARDWALRCMHESQMHAHNSFITLTYTPECLPHDGGLRVGDVQRFFKRVRKSLGKVRFYHCGEYGSENLRPHYHALLFGQDFHNDRVQVQETPYPKYRSATLDRLWGLGRTDIGDVTYQSAAYVARYVNKAGVALRRIEKDMEDPRLTRVDPDTGECWQVPREYSTMSRRPGIGASWLEKYHGDVYPSDEVVHDGKKFPPPRFYDSKFPSLTDQAEGQLEEIKASRVRVAKGSKENSPARLAVRERCAVARLRLRRREL